MAGGCGLCAFHLFQALSFIAATWEWVLGVRFSDRLGKGIRTAPRDALVADSIDEKQRGLAFGVHRAGDTAGAFLGLGIAALIVWFTEANGLKLEQHTFQIAVLISFVPAVLGVVALIWGAHEVPMKTKRKSALPSLEGLDTRFKLFLFVVLVFTLGNSSDSFIILLGQNRGLDIVQIMLMLMTFNFVYASLSGPLGSWSDKIGRRRLIIGGWIAYGLVYLGWPFRTPAGMFGFFIRYTGSIMPPRMVSAVRSLPTLFPKNGAAPPTASIMPPIGITVLPASVIAGVLWQGLGAWHGFGASAPFYFGAALALLAGILFWRLVPSK